MTMTWLWWALLLILQNASFTWVSRARNSGSLGYHALASVFSNGVWIISQFVMLDLFLQAKHADDFLQLVAVCIFYTIFTVGGSVSMHHILQSYVEKGRRKVGAS